MGIHVALNHRTSYCYDRPVSLAPQVIRLRPCVHCRTPIHSYSIRVSPEGHFENWQQDPHGNLLLRAVFPEKVREFSIEVDLVAEMVVINPFDFFVEEYATNYPFEYEPWLASEVRPYRECEPAGPLLATYLRGIDTRSRNTVDFLVELNSQLQQDIGYLIRLEPGVQTPEETLRLRTGSCRDTAWLLVHLLRHLGLAARFVSGYLVQLTPDVKSLDGPSGPEQDFTDLHAWAEVFVPGAGWIGLDPTSGLLADEGHIPLACTPDPSGAAPVTGGLTECETEFSFAMRVTRVREEPRVTKPYSDEQWERILQVGAAVDQRLEAGDVRLTMGGEPTFISIDDMDGAEWNTAAMGPHKRQLAAELMLRLRNAFAPGSLVHFGQGKWYPGESLPRWAFSCFWRRDGIPIQQRDDLIAAEGRDYGHGLDEAEAFTRRLAEHLEVEPGCALPAFEDPWHYLAKEYRLPPNVTPDDPRLKDPEERARLVRVFAQGLDQPRGFILPLARQWWQARPVWVSSPWPVRGSTVYLLPGDSPIGLRLPLDSLPWVPVEQIEPVMQLDPTATRVPFGVQAGRAAQPNLVRRVPQPIQRLPMNSQPMPAGTDDGSGIVRTALCVEPRDGQLKVFMPPVPTADDYLELVATVERTADELQMPVALEGYLPPSDHRLNHIKVTPDPGVIEVNIHPAHSWDELVATTTRLYEEARLTRLGTNKFDLDGRHTGTGGGNHVVLGGPTPLDSPFLRRPDLLGSLIAFWNNHPSLSYLFSSSFIGPTSQAPRVDEGRRDAVYELEIALAQLRELAARSDSACPPWVVDRVLRNLLVDLTGNTHRAEFCIDKLYSPDSATGRLGLVEFRAFEMPPHARMSVTQQLLLRALVARFWEQPYRERLVSWGTTLHDRFLLPYFVWADFEDVIARTCEAGIPLEAAWFAAHHEFRFPLIGRVVCSGIELELRQAIEPWYVLGEEPGGGGTVRFVDSSVERLQVRVRGLTGERHRITCNGRGLPLTATGVEGEFVAGVRYRAWQPPSCLHPLIPVDTPLVFDLYDRWNGRSLGGCTYHVAHPAGRNYTSFPVNAYEAESRRAARFFVVGHSGGPLPQPADEPNACFPVTLDLRRGKPTT